MTIDEVEPVTLRKDNDRQKFLLMEVIDLGTNTRKLIIRTGTINQIHEHIARHTASVLGLQFKIRPLGGGRIQCDEKTHHILVYDYSRGFDEEPDREGTTLPMLRAAYPDWDVRSL